MGLPTLSMCLSCPPYTLHLSPWLQMSPFEDTTTTIPDHVAMVEAVRRADILDFTLGFVSMGMPHKHIVAVQNKMPNAGFHVALLNMGPKIHGFNLANYAGIFTIFKK